MHAAWQPNLSWSWVDRAVVLSLLCPVLLNLLAVAWPLLAMDGYEAHHKGVHRCIVYSQAVCRLAQHAGRRAWMHVSLKQHLPAEVLLFILHQVRCTTYRMAAHQSCLGPFGTTAYMCVLGVLY